MEGVDTTGWSTECVQQTQVVPWYGKVTGTVTAMTGGGVGGTRVRISVGQLLLAEVFTNAQGFYDADVATTALQGKDQLLTVTAFKQTASTTHEYNCNSAPCDCINGTCGPGGVPNTQTVSMAAFQ